MQLRSTACCGLIEMYGMGTVDDPKAHLLSVCKSWWPAPQMPNMAHRWMIATVHGQYMFHGVVKYTGSKDGRYSETAAENLAKYIRRHKLGTVVGSKPAANRVNHPDHILRVFVWNPDVDAMKAWYQKNCPDKDRPPVAEPNAAISTMDGFFTLSSSGLSAGNTVTNTVTVSTGTTGVFGDPT